MSKEIKKQEPETVTSNRKYVVLTVIAILVVIGTIMTYSPKEETVIVSTEPEMTENVTNEKPVEKAMVARIDIAAPLVNTDKTQFEVYVDDSDLPEKQAEWMFKFGKQGYVIQSDNGVKDVVIKALNDVDIKISLKGKRIKSKEEIIPDLVKYTVFTINDEQILKKNRTTWYSKPFNYVIKANEGKEYKIHIEWTNADK